MFMPMVQGGHHVVDRSNYFVNGTASSSTAYASAYDAAKAFDNDATTRFLTINQNPHFLQYDLGSGNDFIIQSYGMENPTAEQQEPKSWTFKGSNNGSSFTTLDTVSGFTSWDSQKEFTFSTSGNTTSYRYYRIEVTEAFQSSFAGVSIQEMTGYIVDNNDQALK